MLCKLPKLLTAAESAARPPPPDQDDKVGERKTEKQQREAGKDKDEAQTYQRESDRRRACEEVAVLCKPQVVPAVLDRSLTRGTTAPA